MKQKNEKADHLSDQDHCKRQQGRDLEEQRRVIMDGESDKASWKRREEEEGDQKVGDKRRLTFRPEERLSA